MNNFLDNGTVMPHGLLSCDPSDFNRGLNKTYSNTALRFGIVTQIYSVNDPGNISKLSTEYDVDVIEQDMNRGMAPITYKNCLSVDGLGSIADYFEKNFRVQTQTENQALPLTKGQNGATVLVLCIDSTMGKGVILGGLNHPDRPTNLTSTAPMLFGEYNGVAVNILADGSTSLTWNSATDNNGDVIDSSNGTTILAIGTDGTFSVTNNTATVKIDNTAKEINMATSGNWTVNIQGNTNITTQGDTNINTQGTANIIAQGTTTVDGSTIKLGVDAVQSVIRGNDFALIFDNHVHYGNLGLPTSPPLEPMDSSLSTLVFTK